MKNILKGKENIVIFVLVILGITLVLGIATLIVDAKKSLDKTIYNAKKEVQKEMLLSEVYELKSEQEEKVVPLSEVTLPQNTNEDPQKVGRVVAPKENWNIETVTAISIGNGETVPVPNGFYYVGGDLSTGVIISDDEADVYDGQTDKTTWEYTTRLKGNQFVWIPSIKQEYAKSEIWNGIIQKPSGTVSGVGTLSSGGAWDKTTYCSELPQIEKYGGFYVARYEAGLAKTITEFTSTQRHTGLNQVYNIEGIPQSRAGVIPWMFIDWTHAHKNAKNMYNTSSVSSGLITGTQWDVMLKQMVKKTNLTEKDLTNSEKWGNYRNTNITYIRKKINIYRIFSISFWRTKKYY